MRGIRSEHNIQRLDLPPTRITPTSETSIDCVCTLMDHNVEVMNTRISDHTAQFCTIDCVSKIPIPPINEQRNVSSYNLIKL